MTVQPFGNTIDMIKIKGVFLKQAFENSVKRYDPSDLRGAFLQMSGKKFQQPLVWLPPLDLPYHINDIVATCYKTLAMKKK